MQKGITSTATGVTVAMIHGFMARGLTQRHLLRFVREAGYSDTTLYGYLYPRAAIADDLSKAAANGRRVILIGYSQGGFHAIKVARELEKRKVPVALLVTIAAGGLGRLHPAQWGFDPRQLPSNVLTGLNFFAEGDLLGCDRQRERNLLKSTCAGQHIENIRFGKHERISHTGLVTCYPESRVHPSVKAQLLNRLLDELSSLTTSC